jgi:hypothetical protein
MDWATQLVARFPEYWKEYSIVIAGIVAILGVIWEVKDRKTEKITGWGRVFLSITIILTLGTFFAQSLENRASDKRSKQSQEETLELLKHTRQSVLELSRLLQPLDKPLVTIFLDLSCGPAAYQAFCLSAQSQAEAAVAPSARDLPPGSSIGLGTDHFDWSKWPNPRGPFGITLLRFFKSREKFEDYAKGGCLNCAEAGDLKLTFIISTKVLSPNFRVKADGVDVIFLASNKEPSVRANNTEIMSVPDLNGAIVALSYSGLFDILIPTAIFIDTPRGQQVMGNVQFREVNGNRIYFAQFPKT